MADEHQQVTAVERASPNLRATFLLLAAVMLAVWGWSLVPAIVNWNNPREDGFSLIPGFWATLTLLPLGIFTLLGGIVGRGKSVARARACLSISGGLVVLAVLFEIFRRLSVLGD
jgi:high-affinity Fe2+/Pb2+ permease